ncbi:MAG TPA: hypothetical protein VHX62_03485, partial [Solirubrobacteraceae bacterium]|nr:hypothetical protein [Solirubrobacteraceae bacterium]
LGHLKNNAVAYVALFVALGGTSYAAIKLPAGSVGNRQLKNHSVTPIKLDTGSIAGYIRDWVRIGPTGTIIGSHPKAHLVNWNETAAGTPGGLVSWGHPVPQSCLAVATTGTAGIQPTYAGASISSSGAKNGPFVGAYVRLSAPQTAVSVVVVCPQP